MKNSLAHELNNTLIIISGNLELIERRVGDNQEVKEMIASALASVQKAKELTQILASHKKKD